MKTLAILSTAMLSILVLILSTSNSNGFQSNLREPENFYGIIANVNANIIIRQSERNSIKVDSKSGKADAIHFSIENGILVIRGEENTGATIYINVEDISLIESNGYSRILVEGVISSDILLLKANQYGSIKADVRTLKTAVYANNHAKIFVSGTTGESLIHTSEGGKVFSEKLDTVNASSERKLSRLNEETQRSSSSMLSQ